MATEEKAKAYDMALEAARKELGVDRKEWEVVQRVLHNIFPELRNSEDEKIRKFLIKLVNDGLTCFPDSLMRSDVLTYLEKQKVFAEHGYGLYYYHNGGFTFVARPAEEKDEENPYDFAMSQQKKQKEQKPTDDVLHRTYQEGFNDGLNYRLEGTGVKYVKDNPKQEWSEEDEKRIKQLIYDTEAIRAGYEKKKEQLGDRFNDALIKDCDEQIRWLKSLRPQPHWKPSEEQMRLLKYLAKRIDVASHERHILDDMIDDLKKLM